MTQRPETDRRPLSSVIRNVGARIADSLIGRDVTIESSLRKPHVIRLMIGDHSVVDIA